MPTPAIDNSYDAVLRWIDNRAPGGMIHGKPRIGKTRAIRYLTGLLAEKYGASLRVFTLPCRDYKTPSEATFFEDLLRATGHAFYRPGKAAAKRDRLLEFLVERVEASSQDRLILFIDEAQKLLEQHYKWLIDLYNELDAHGVSPVFLLVGQEELVHQCSAFQQARKTQIVGRFMSHQHRFRGPRNLGEIKACLHAYDECSEYPVDSGWSFTKYYFPAAFASGFRLDAHAVELWEAFSLIKEECGFAGVLEIPMQYLCRSVECVLRRHGTLDEAPPSLSIDLWKEAVKASGFVDAERYN